RRAWLGGPRVLWRSRSQPAGLAVTTTCAADRTMFGIRQSQPNGTSQERDLGLHASRQLIHRITQHIEQALGPKATVSVQQSGTIVVLLLGDRAEAERTARKLVDELEGQPLRLSGRRAVSVKIACGIIAFSQTGHAVAESIPT